MRIRCSKGIRINSFHGHFFIRSTDLLALPQVRAALHRATTCDCQRLVVVVFCRSRCRVER